MKEKYKIDKIDSELPICVFVEGFNGMSSGNLTKLFSSIENQNYSNFQFVYVDDFSMDSTLKNIYNFMFTNFSKLLYKTKQIVFN
jgi:glycosyltransferase involved in cell wall biosynthesis